MTYAIDRTRCHYCGEVGSLSIDVKLVGGRERPVLTCGVCEVSLPGEFDGDTRAVFRRPR